MRRIPFTKGFSADADGNIYGPDGVQRSQYTNADGYKTASVKMDDNTWVTFGVQRLVALAYHQVNGDHLLLTVNHLDGNIENNKPGNLEWVTAGKNIVHGILLNRFTDRPLIIAHKEKMEFYFNDLYDISRYLKTDTDTIWARIKDDQPFNGWTIRHLKHSDMDAQNLRTAKPQHISTRTRALKMLDLETNKETKFSSMHEAAKYFKVGVTHIRHRISTPKYPKVFKSRYLLVDAPGNFEFFNEDVLKRSEGSKAKPVLVYNLKAGEFEIFKSAYQLLKAHRELSKKAITMRLKKGLLTETDGRIVKRLIDLEKDKAAILEVARPFV